MVLADSGPGKGPPPGLQTASFCCVLTWQRESLFFNLDTNSIVGTPPSSHPVNQIAFPKAHLLKPSHWVGGCWVGLHHLNLGERGLSLVHGWH